MPGPQPKPLDMRQHRKKATTRAVLVADDRSELVPELPPHPKEEMDWLPMVRQWWSDVWTSPMAAEYLDSDFHPLLRLAYLNDKFWRTGSNTVAAEIRMLERDFGLSPLNRRRLEWQVVAAEDAKDKHHQRRLKQAVVVQDPRQALQE